MGLTSTRKTSEYIHAQLLTYGWVAGHPGARFTIASLAREIEASEYFVAIALASSEISQLVEHHPERELTFTSTAPPLNPTIEGILVEIYSLIQAGDIIGEQARYEFWFRSHAEFANHRKHGTQEIF